jgi:integrase
VGQQPLINAARHTEPSAFGWGLCGIHDWTYRLTLEPDAEPLDDGRLTYNWKIACLAAGVHGHVFHSTRHRFASHLLSLGMDVVTVARLMGPKNADQVLRRYGHVTADYMDRAREALTAARQATASRG